MKPARHIVFNSIFSCVLVAAATSLYAQQINGTPGSPDATVVIEGKQIPPPPLPFGGVIKESALDSKPYWPPRVVPPKGAPNILLIMTDDQGYGVSGTFGGVIPTPALDRVAKAGLRYIQFHSTALCSPTRAALITGRNHHSMGFGVISELSTGYPGYDSVMSPEKASIGTILRDNGYATSWFGKNHNTPAFQLSVSGPYDQWPSGMGFEYFYGFPVSRSYPDLPVDRKTRLQSHHRPGGRSNQAYARSERRRARAALLRLLRAWRHSLTAPAEAGVGREVQRQV
jgi:arylsulfatase